jgi:hypothetical protein
MFLPRRGNYRALADGPQAQLLPTVTGPGRNAFLLLGSASTVTVANSESAAPGAAFEDVDDDCFRGSGDLLLSLSRVTLVGGGGSAGATGCGPSI